MPKYTITGDEQSMLSQNFVYHSPHGTQTERYQLLRGEANRLATSILGDCPPSRERALALTKLEEAVFWANASIARNENETAG